MSWGAQNRSKDAKTPSVAGVRSQKPELDCCPVQPYPIRDANLERTQVLVFSCRSGSQKKKAGRVTCDEIRPVKNQFVRSRFLDRTGQNRDASKGTYDGLQSTGMMT
jgi:hypothetical protein